MNTKGGFDVYLRKAIEDGVAIFPEKFCIGPDPEERRTDLDRLKISQGSYHFCTPGETPILMSDWKTKPIEHVKIGDEIVGYTLGHKTGKHGRLVKSRVLRTFSRKDSVLRLFMKSGREVLCTKKHRWYIVNQDKGCRSYAPANIGSQLTSFSSVERRLSGRKDIVTDIKYERLGNVYALETKTGNYIAWGYASSNSAQYYNDPVDDDAIEFKRRWINKYDELPKEGVDHLFVDPAFTLKQTNDPSGLIVTRISSDNIIYIMEAIRIFVDTPGLINEIFRLNTIHPNIRITYIESVAAQVMLLNLLRMEMVKREKFFTIEEYMPSTREKKAIRIRGLIPRYEAGGILHKHGLPELEAELIEFPRGTRDDLIDALSQGVNIWKAPSKIIEHAEKEGTFDWWRKKANKPKQTRMGSLFDDMIPNIR